MDKLKELKEVMHAINEGSVTTKDLQVFIATILEFVKNHKNEFLKVSQENLDDMQSIFLEIEKRHDEILNNVDKKTAKAEKEFSHRIQEVKSLVNDVKSLKFKDGLNGKDGKDADEERIIASILSTIRIPESKQETGKTIIDKINELPADKDNQIDASHIKNLPQSGNFYGGSGIKEVIAGSNITIDNTNLGYPVISSTGGGGVGVDDINGLTGSVTLSAGSNVSLDQVGNDIEINANFTQMGKYMISGGATWSGTGLTYDVSFLTYFFSGNKTANPTSVTLDPSDPTFNRLDAIVVDEAGVISVITGDASSSPVEPPIPADKLQVQFILVEAGSTAPTIASENIYLDDPTSNWTFSTYSTATPTTGSINFAGTNTPKQGINDIEASTDLRLGARFVRATSFDAYQYTMLQVWVRFTGTAVASNKSLNVRFENSAGTLVANTINLFNYGLQRGVLNTWQLVVVPITAFGALPATVKGLKMIMAGGTVGQVRQWDVDYMILTNGSVPFANVPTIAFSKNGTGIASQSGLNLIEGTNVSITGVNNPLYNRVDYTINSSGGSPAGSNNQIQINQSGAFFADSTFQKSTSGFNVGLDHTAQSPITFTGSGLDDLTLGGKFSGTVPTTYTVTVASTGTPDTFDWTDGTNSGTGVSMSTSPTLLSNGISITFGADTGHTLFESWTWDYTTVNQNVLDFSNNDYKFQSTFGTDTFGYQIGDNLFGVGFKGSLNTYSNLAGDIGLSGINNTQQLQIIDQLSFADGNSTTQSLLKNQYDIEVNNSTESSVIGMKATTFGVSSFLSSGEHGISQSAGVFTIGNLYGGNNTKITVDDVTQLITVSNVPTYADDASAATGGLTTGQLYKTTTLGTTSLNIVP